MENALSIIHSGYFATPLARAMRGNFLALYFEILILFGGAYKSVGTL